jgi:hypothetical protein
MATVTFDTLELMEKLKAAGFGQEQAEAVVRAISEAQDELIKKADLEQALAPIRTDLTLLKWMIGAVLAGIISLILRALI